MKELTIKSAKKYISEELSYSYPKEEITSLSKIILQEVTQLSQIDILGYPDRLLDNSSWHKISKICADLKKMRPIQHILGKTEFFGIKLYVNEHTLIPRQETEELVNLIINENSKSELKIIDIGTGSGAIAIALAKNLNKASLTATDFSENALKKARQNSEENGCNIEFIEDDIFNSSLKAKEIFNIVVSNPPYIRDSEKSSMNKNVLDYEPKEALFVSDDDPLIYYREIGKKALSLLKEDGYLYFEINEALGSEIIQLITSLGFREVRIIKDINNKDRILSSRK